MHNKEDGEGVGRKRRGEGWAENIMNHGSELSTFVFLSYIEEKRPCKVN